MSSTFEIIVPLRNPTGVMERTITSLASQTRRDFSVLLSDNFSKTGGEVIASSVKLLESAGLPARIVHPPEELGRVEHWNWSHRQSSADWIKPLFVGDWLEPGYVGKIRSTIEGGPLVEIINCSVISHSQDGGKLETTYTGGYRAPAEVLAGAYRKGNEFGGPVNVCYRRLAFDLVGGYPPALPVSAGFWLILQLALRKGLTTCPEPLANFHFHPARFTTNFPWDKIDGDREWLIILLAATSFGCISDIKAPVGPRNRLILRMMKSRIKRRFSRGGCETGFFRS